MSTIKKLRLFLYSRFKSTNLRNQKLLVSGGAAIGSKFITVLIGFISFPLAYSYLDSERFGLLTYLVSVLSTISFLDFGLGFGLQNRWAEVEKGKKEVEIRMAVSTVFFFLLIVSFLICLLTIYSYQLINVAKIFSIDPLKIELVSEAKKASTVYILSACVSFPFSIIQKIQIGKQEGYKTNIWQTLGNLFSLVLLLTFCHLKLDLPYIIFALYGFNNLFVILNFIYEFLVIKEIPMPEIKYFSIKFLMNIMGDGFVYITQQISSTLLLASNSFLLAKYYGFSVVGNFNIGFKLISFLLIPIEAIAPYFLPALNNALALGDMTWAVKSIKRFIKGIIIIGVFSAFVTYYAGYKFIELWMGSSNILSDWEYFSFAILVFTFALIYFASYTMLSPKFIKKSMIGYPIAVIFTIYLKSTFVEHYGIAGINFAHSFGMTSVYFVLAIYLLNSNKLLRF